jgi:hypothetical protein
MLVREGAQPPLENKMTVCGVFQHTCSFEFSEVAEKDQNTIKHTTMNINVDDDNWYRQYAMTIPGEWNGKKNDRKAFLITPNTTAPLGGWPVLMYFAFMLPNGTVDEWAGLEDYPNVTYPPGILPAEMLKLIEEQELKSVQDFLNPRNYLRERIQGHYTLQVLLRGLLQIGYAVVMTTEYCTDCYFYADCTGVDPDNICWNHGDNPDTQYMLSLIERLNRYDVNTANIGLMGYSVGAQMVSRLINEAFRPDVDIKWPEWKFGIMIAGGSMFCYDDTLRCPSHLKPHGCCPVGRTEEVFDDKHVPWSRHPPSILVQTKHDIYADNDAMRNYFGVLKRHNAEAVAVYSEGFRHGVCACQVTPILNAVKKFGKTNASHVQK